MTKVTNEADVDKVAGDAESTKSIEWIEDIALAEWAETAIQAEEVDLMLVITKKAVLVASVQRQFFFHLCTVSLIKW